MAKYGFSGVTISVAGVSVSQIICLTAFSDVAVDDVGGFIEKETNLSQTGDCWVYDSAVVMSSGSVTGNAAISGHAVIFGNAWVKDEAVVSGRAHVSGYVVVGEYARVSDNAELGGPALRVAGDAHINGNTSIFEPTRIS